MKVCPSCQQEKPLADFPPNRRRADGRQAQCRTCYSAYQRDYYRRQSAEDLEYRQRRKALRKIRLGRRKRENRERLWSYLADHPCVDCGEEDPVVLEFDHVDPGQKSFAVGNGIFWKSWDEIARELEQCVVRCATCHRRRTARQRGFYSYLDLGT